MPSSNTSGGPTKKQRQAERRLRAAELQAAQARHGLLTGLLLLYLLFREISPPLAHEPESFDAVGLFTQVVQVVGVAAALGLARLNRETPRTRHAD